MSGAALDSGRAAALQECLLAGGVAVFPADTVYGLACDPSHRDAFGRIYEMKGRPAAKPAAVMWFSPQAAADELARLPTRTCQAARALLPGPVTLLLPNPDRRFPLACDPGGADAASGTAGAASGTACAASGSACAASGSACAASNTAGAANGIGGAASGTGSGAAPGPPPLGLRVPAWPPQLAALALVESPALQSSANLSGDPPPRRLHEVPQSIRDAADLVIDGGELPGLASTVIDLQRLESEARYTIVREGALGEQQVRAALAALIPC